MDPFTHAVIGLGVGALSGQPLSPYNPVYCAAVVGAIIPDLDVVTLLKGEYFLIKHHRGASHSLGGFLLFSAVVAGIIRLDFGFHPLPYFFWALGGALSHGLLDYFNSYGIQIWWPFCKKRYTGNLLMFSDPLLLLMFLPILVNYRQPFPAAVPAFFGAGLYLFLRWKMRRQAEGLLRKKYAPCLGKKRRLAVLPALKSLTQWDFMIEKPHEIIIGTLDYFNKNISSSRHMPKTTLSPLINKALETVPGRLFCQFTSLYFISQWKEKGRHFVRLADLRFKHRSDFLYKLTLIFNEQLFLEEAYLCHQNNFTPIDIT